MKYPHKHDGSQVQHYFQVVDPIPYVSKKVAAYLNPLKNEAESSHEEHKNCTSKDTSQMTSTNAHITYNYKFPFLMISKAMHAVLASSLTTINISTIDINCSNAHTYETNSMYDALGVRFIIAWYTYKIHIVDS